MNKALGELRYRVFHMKRYVRCMDSCMLGLRVDIVVLIIYLITDINALFYTGLVMFPLIVILFYCFERRFDYHATKARKVEKIIESMYRE